MKRILLACILFTAATSVISFQHASAQTVTTASFTVEVNLLDSYIGAGNMAMAQTTWDSLNVMMGRVLDVTKTSIRNATTVPDRTMYTHILEHQSAIYAAANKLRANMTANRTVLHTKLHQFDLTIY